MQYIVQQLFDESNIGQLRKWPSELIFYSFNFSDMIFISLGYSGYFNG